MRKKYSLLVSFHLSWNPHLTIIWMKSSSDKSLNRDTTSAILITPPILRTRLASLTKSLRFVPISERQNTTTSQQSFCKGVWAKSHTVTKSLTLTKSKLCTVEESCKALANLASPHPKSAISKVPDIFIIEVIILANGSTGHFEAWDMNPS